MLLLIFSVICLSTCFVNKLRHSRVNLKTAELDRLSFFNAISVRMYFLLSFIHALFDCLDSDVERDNAVSVAYFNNTS